MYLTSPSIGSSGVHCFFLSIFYFFLKDVALVDYYLDKDTILEDLDC